MTLWNTHGYQAYLKRTKQGFNKKTFVKFLKSVSKGTTLTDAIDELYWQNMILAATVKGLVLLMEVKKKEEQKKHGRKK